MTKELTVDQDLRKYVTAKRAMKLMGISHPALCKQVNMGQLTKFKRRRNTFYLLSEVESYNAIKRVG